MGWRRGDSKGAASVPAGRRGQAQLLLGVVRLLLARQHGNLPAVAEEARRLQALTEAPDAVPAGLGEELRALALVNLGITEYWGGRLAEAEPHLEHGITLARKIGRPYLNCARLGPPHVHRHRAVIALRAGGRARPADDRTGPAARLDRAGARGIAYNTLAAGGIWRRQLEEAADWVRRAERTLRAEADPMTAIVIRYIRALLELARGRYQEVLATFEAAERLSRLLDAPDWPLMRARALRLHALVRLGETGRAEQDIAEIGERGPLSGEIRMALAALRIAQNDPHAATAALAPVLSDAVPVAPATWLSLACLLEAVARDALGEPAAARDTMRRALDAATPDGVLATFLFHPPARELFDRYAPDRGDQGALAAEIRNLLPAEPPEGPPAEPKLGPPRGPPRPADSFRLVDPLSKTEIRVLRYLPTNLPTPEIARELSLSMHTVRTHIRHLFAELGAHGRTKAVARRRALGLLAHPQAAERLRLTGRGSGTPR